ncbi:MAG TPA: hypothetical protein VHP33_38430, partial [Polyangiaceae bacterium]|nr:hypothetical protein [Polyangiaceae bacterium]
MADANRTLVVALAGRRVDAADAAEQRFPAANVPAVKERLRKALADAKATTLVCAAACGVDLLALDAAGELGVRRRIVLPTTKAEFRASSVVDRPGSWGELFDRIISEVEAKGDLTIHGLGSGDAAYRAGNRAILDDAQALGGDLEAWVVWNGRPRSDGDITLHFADEAWTRRLRVRELLTQPRRGDKPDYATCCFIAMPFGLKPSEEPRERQIDFDAVFSTIIAPAIESVSLPEGGKLRAYRTDRDPAAGLIDDDMYKGLEYSRLTFCDLTGLNFNVGLELGVRYRARSSGTVVFRQPGTKIAFDIAQVKVLDYDPATPNSAREAITHAVTESLKQNRLDSPVQRTIASTRSAAVDALMKDAENALRKWDPAGARLKYHAALQLDSADATIWLRLATLDRDAGNWQGAADAAKRATQLLPDYGEAWREYGVAQSQLHRTEPTKHPDDGVAALQRAIALNPKDFDALACLGGALKRQNKLSEALDAYRASLVISDKHPYPLLNAIKLEAALTGHLDLAKYRSAIKQAAKAREQQMREDYDMPWSLFDTIELNLYRGNGDKALELVDDA